MREGAAIRLAIDLMQVPSRVRHAREGDLPDGMELLLRSAAGEVDALATASELTSRPSAVIRAAAAFFVEQILLCDDADSYRVLGARRDSPASELRRNMALLARCLHPDVAGLDSQSLFASRLTFAWNDLKTPEHRAEYDKRLKQRSDTKPIDSRIDGRTRKRWKRRQGVTSAHASHGMSLALFPERRLGFFARLRLLFRGND